MTKTFSPFFAALLVAFSLIMLAADRASAGESEATVGSIEQLDDR
ncbi:MAG: hypothetical protein WBO47_06740 [Gammaproteobacteria bacterium]